MSRWGRGDETEEHLKLEELETKLSSLEHDSQTLSPCVLKSVYLDASHRLLLVNAERGVVVKAGLFLRHKGFWLKHSPEVFLKLP